MLKFAATISAGLLLVILIGSLKGTNELSTTASTAVSLQVGTVKSLGKVLFKEFLLPFEVSSILLLAAMVGAVMLGKPEKNQSTK